MFCFNIYVWIGKWFFGGVLIIDKLCIFSIFICNVLGIGVVVNVSIFILCFNVLICFLWCILNCCFLFIINSFKFLYCIFLLSNLCVLIIMLINLVLSFFLVCFIFLGVLKWFINWILIGKFCICLINVL